MTPEELRGSGALREAMADDVVDHCVNNGTTERRLPDQVVTCYERERMFERG